jgi:tetratricopeptide (TPR) repeat protein
MRLNLAFGEEKPELSKDWKEKGNFFYRRNKFYNAIRAYTSGIQENPKDASLFANRAMVFMSIGHPTFALADAEESLKLEPSNVKVMWRKAVALCRIKRHKDAISFLKKVIPDIPNGTGKELKNLLLSTEAVWNTGRLGQHSLEEAKRFPPGIYLNYAEYKGPIRISKIEGKGRGLVATKEIPFGALVIASRAFDIVSLDSNKVTGALECNVQSMIYNSPSHNRLIASIANRLMTRPELKKELYQLSAGKKYGYIDPSAAEGSELLVDMQRIGGICNINTFGTNANGPDGKDFSGLWILPSYINHTW